MAGQEYRINKILKEFNIGLGTLVDFLKKKGFDVESVPNATISHEAYTLVAKEYAKEQKIKEESKKVAIKVKDITEKESKSEKEEEPYEKEVFIKSNISSSAKPEPAVEKVAQSQSTSSGLKIIGKIDLDRKSTPKPSAAPVKEAAKEQKSPEKSSEKRAAAVQQPAPKTKPAPVVQEKSKG